MTSSDDSFLGKEGTYWQIATMSTPGRNQSQNILRQKEGVKPYVRARVCSILDSWLEFVDNKILDKLILYSNAHEKCDKPNSKADLLKFIGLQYIQGLYNKSIPLAMLWSKNYGIPIFSATMSRNKYEYIMRILRFDNKNSRSQRLNTDKFAAVREIFDLFVANCKEKYTPHFSLTVDEELMPLKSRCRFIMFMANKPDKYGIKFWDLVEVNSKYLVNCIPYLGKEEREHMLSEDVVLKLADHLQSGYNVTGDNFFSSGSLCKNLLRKSISYVGTVRANRRELCNHMRRQQDLYATTFYKDSEHKLLLAAYRCKPAKTVFLISTMHKNPVLENDAKSKPELVKFYNQNKVGVDCIDQMIRLYSTRTTTRRWSFAVWCNILDKAAINAWIIYTKITGEKSAGETSFLPSSNSYWKPKQTRTIRRFRSRSPATSRFRC